MNEQNIESQSDISFMRRAIELAKKGEGRTNPNPLVGAVIVKDNKIIGEGFHREYGNLHAEREALKDCVEKQNDPWGASIYVTLEPCCHQGKQPPCTQAILDAGIKEVIVGSRDPNPLVHGKGNAFLRSNGITVKEDFLKEECDYLNPIFFHFITTRKPYVALKYAMTLDGKIATAAKESKWISCQKSREHAHSLRNKYSCILAGINTVLNDNPLLTCRIEGGRNPVRIICDSKLLLPPDSEIARSAKEVRTIAAYAVQNSEPEEIQKRKDILNSLGIETVQCGEKKVDLVKLMDFLGSQNLDSVLIEGGAEINYSALESGIVNHIYTYVSPKIFGGRNAPSPVGGNGIEKVESAFYFKPCAFRQIENDFLIEYESLPRAEDNKTGSN